MISVVSTKAPSSWPCQARIFPADDVGLRACADSGVSLDPIPFRAVSHYAKIGAPARPYQAAPHFCKLFAQVERIVLHGRGAARRTSGLFDKYHYKDVTHSQQN